MKTTQTTTASIPSTSAESSRWIKGKEAAAQLHFSEQTIRRYADQGYIRHTRTEGNQRRYLREDIDCFTKEVKPDLELEINNAEKNIRQDSAL